MDSCQRVNALAAGHTIAEFEVCVHHGTGIATPLPRVIFQGVFQTVTQTHAKRTTICVKLNRNAWLKRSSGQLNVPLLNLFRPARNVAEHAVNLFEPLE